MSFSIGQVMCQELIQILKTGHYSWPKSVEKNWAFILASYDHTGAPIEIWHKEYLEYVMEVKLDKYTSSSLEV